LPATRETFTSYAFADRNTGWAVNNAQIFHTADGGKNWTAQVDASSQTLRVGRFIDANVGWVGGEEGILLHTADSGTTWDTQREPGASDLLALHWASSGPSFGWALDSSGMLEFTPDGEKWDPVPNQSRAPRNQRLTAGYMRGFGEAWAVGPMGTVLHNPDGGPDWEDQESHARDTLRDIHLQEHGFGYTVGPLGLIVNTTTAGRRWRHQRSTTGYDLNATYAATPHVGWTVGQYGMVLNTANRGEEWAAQRSHTSAELHDVFALSDMEAYAVGDDGAIVHTVDGGESWVVQDTPIDTPLYSVFMSADGSTLWALGAWGVVMRAPRAGQPSARAATGDEATG
ncbi:hypothetical protein HN937_07400, partial [Candidatus Poribacteria bacterium]|nr:hypothetical protein [Candidatus Poribacteria bacterium]